MDWPRARAILLMAFTVVNGLLAYAVWGPSVSGSAVIGRSDQAHLQTVRARLGELGMDLAVAIPNAPPLVPQFLRVEYNRTPDIPHVRAELFGDIHGRFVDQLEVRALELGDSALEPSVDRATGVVLYQPFARGSAAREIRLENRQAVRQAIDEYLRSEGLHRTDSRFTRFFPAGEALVGVEYIQIFEAVPVFTGYRRVIVSRNGIEKIEEQWAKPLTFRGEQKAVLAPTEALLRVAGHVGGQGRRTFTEIELGYYAGRPLGGAEGSALAEDLVPVWRIALDSGEVFYINAFTGELE